VIFIKEQGAEKAYPEITTRPANSSIAICTSSSISSTARCWRTASNEKFVGKDMSDAQDVDGKLYVRERVELAGKQPSFWQDYKFVNPVSKKSSRSRLYCEKLDNTAVCVQASTSPDTAITVADRSLYRRVDMLGWIKNIGLSWKFSSRRRS